MRGWQPSVNDSSKNLAPVAVAVVPGSLPNEQLEPLLYSVGLQRSCSALELAFRFLRISLQAENVPNLSLDLIQEVGIRATHHSQTLLQLPGKQCRTFCSVDGGTQRCRYVFKKQPSRVTRAKHEIPYSYRVPRTQL